MFFSPQRRALFRHLSSIPPKVVRTWFVLNILIWTCVFRCAAAACNSWTVRARHVFDILTSNCASRHSGVQFSMSHPARWLCPPPALASLRLGPPGPQIIRKNTVFRAFPNISRACIFFLATVSLLYSSLFFSSLLYSSLLSDSSYLCLSSLHIVGSLTSELPLNITPSIWEETIFVSSTIAKQTNIFFGILGSFIGEMPGTESCCHSNYTVDGVPLEWESDLLLEVRVSESQVMQCNGMLHWSSLPWCKQAGKQGYKAIYLGPFWMCCHSFLSYYFDDHLEELAWSETFLCFTNFSWPSLHLIRVYWGIYNPSHKPL